MSDDEITPSPQSEESYLERLDNNERNLKLTPNVMNFSKVIDRAGKSTRKYSACYNTGYVARETLT